MKKILLVLCLVTAPCLNAGPALDEPIPGMGDASEPIESNQAFENLSQYFQTADEFAGSRVGVRLGDQWKIIDRRQEARKPTVSAPNQSYLDKLVGAAANSTAARASLHVSYTRKGIDENGKPFEETLSIDAGMASGAAAAAQSSMDEAMGKQHM